MSSLIMEIRKIISKFSGYLFPLPLVIAKRLEEHGYLFDNYVIAQSFKEPRKQAIAMIVQRAISQEIAPDGQLLPIRLEDRVEDDYGIVGSDLEELFFSIISEAEPRLTKERFNSLPFDLWPTLVTVADLVEKVCDMLSFAEPFLQVRDKNKSTQ